MVSWTAGKNCDFQVFFALPTNLFRDLIFKMFMWYPVCPIPNLWTQKNKNTEKKKLSQKPCPLIESEYQKFLWYLFAKTEIFGKFMYAQDTENTPARVQ